MFVSAFDKDLSYDWTKDGYREYTEDIDLSFYTIKPSELHERNKKQERKIPLTTTKTELSLPKTKLTKKDNKNEEDEYEFPPKKHVDKPFTYTKKWIEDITDNLAFNASHILKERYDYITNDSRPISAVVGKHSNYFINTLRTKSGKDRCMTRASYEEYLPPDFDAKTELQDTLKSYTESRMAVNKSPNIIHSDPRQDMFSFDEGDTDQGQYKSSRTHSRLSGQPVLSSQQLINRLNKNMNNEEFNNNTDLTKFKRRINSAMSSSTVNYKDEFTFNDTNYEIEQPDVAIIEDDSHMNQEEPIDEELELQKLNEEFINQKITEELLRKKMNEDILNKKLHEEMMRKKLHAKSINQKKLNKQKENEELIERKRLLNKREELNENRLKSGALVVKIPVLQSQSITKSEFDEYANHSKTASAKSRPQSKRKPTLHINKQHEKLCYRTFTTQYDDESRLSNVTSRQSSQNVKIVDDRRTSVFTMDSNIQTAANLLNQATQSMNFSNAPSVIDKDAYFSADQQENQEPINDYDSCEPITISVTEINHLSQSVKIRRYFDRETLRIKRMSIGSADSRKKTNESSRTHDLKNMNSNLIKLMDKSVSKMNFEPSLCNNSVTTMGENDHPNSVYIERSTLDKNDEQEIKKNEKLSKEKTNKIKDDLKRRKKTVSMIERIRSAPNTKVGTGKLEISVYERQVKSALAEIKGTNGQKVSIKPFKENIFDDNKISKSNSAGKRNVKISESPQDLDPINLRVASAPSYIKQSTIRSKKGQVIIDLDQIKDHVESKVVKNNAQSDKVVTDADQKSLKSQASTDSNLSHEQILTNISKIVLKEKSEIQSSEENNLYKIVEIDHSKERIDQNANFQLDYSIQANDDNVCIESFKAGLNTCDAKLLKDKLNSDLNYKENQEQQYRENGTGKNFKELEEEVLREQREAKEKELKEAKEYELMQEAKLKEEFNEKEGDRVSSAAVDNLKEFDEEANEKKLDKTEIDNKSIGSDTYTSLNSEKDSLPESHYETVSNNKLLSINNQIISTVSQDLLKSLETDKIGMLPNNNKLKKITSKADKSNTNSSINNSLIPSNSSSLKLESGDNNKVDSQYIGKSDTLEYIGNDKEINKNNLSDLKVDVNKASSINLNNAPNSNLLMVPHDKEPCETYLNEYVTGNSGGVINSHEVLDKNVTEFNDSFVDKDSSKSKALPGIQNVTLKIDNLDNSKSIKYNKIPQSGQLIPKEDSRAKIEIQTRDSSSIPLLSNKADNINTLATKVSSNFENDSSNKESSNMETSPIFESTSIYANGKTHDSLDNNQMPESIAHNNILKNNLENNSKKSSVNISNEGSPLTVLRKDLDEIAKGTETNQFQDASNQDSPLTVLRKNLDVIAKENEIDQLQNTSNKDSPLAALKKDLAEVSNDNETDQLLENKNNDQNQEPLSLDAKLAKLGIFSRTDPNKKERRLKPIFDNSLTLNSLNMEAKSETNTKPNKKVEFSDHVDSKLIQNSPIGENMPSKLNDLNRPVSANSSILKKTDNDASKLNQRIDRYKANEIKTKNDQEISKKDNNNKDTAQNSQDYQNPKIENLRKKLIEPSLQNESLNSNLKNTKKPTDQSKVLTKPKDIKNAKDEPDTSEVKIVEEKPVEKLKPVKVTISPKVHTARYPHLEIPWDFKDPIVDHSTYNRVFQVPDVLCPRVYELNASRTSIDELLLERRILEEKIIETRNQKLNRINQSDKSEKSSREENLSRSIHNDNKEKVYNEERVRLQNENLKKQLELESIEQILITNINEKTEEIQNLTHELNKQSNDFNNRIKYIEDQLVFIENNLIEIKDMVLNSREEIRRELSQKFLEERNNLKSRNQEKKLEKYAEFDEEIKDMDNKIESEVLPEEEINELEKEKNRLGNALQQWMMNFDKKVLEEELLLEEREIQEDKRFAIMQHESEEEAFRTVRKERSELIEERKELIKSFDEIKRKITKRIERINQEKNIIDEEKRSFDESVQKDLEIKKAKLIEILQTEHEARMQIKFELDQYRQSLLKKREENLKLRYSLSFMKHCHAVTKPHEITYMVPLNKPKEKLETIETGDKKTTNKGKK